MRQQCIHTYAIVQYPVADIELGPVAGKAGDKIHEKRYQVPDHP